MRTSGCGSREAHPARPRHDSRPAPPVPPLARRGLLARIALYVVSFSLWLLLALASRSVPARCGGAAACVITLLILVGYVRRYRALGRGERGR